MHDIALFVGGDGHIIEANAAAARVYGVPAGDLIGLPVQKLCYSRGSCAIERTLQSGEARTCECLHTRADGSIVPVEISTIRGEIDGEPLVLCVARDVSQRQRRDLLQVVIHEIDNAILRGQPLDEVLEIICRHVVAMNGYPLVQISIKQPDGGLIVRGRSGLASAFLDGIELRWNGGAASLGPTGRAIREGRLQVSDIATDPGFGLWREKALAFGLRSAISLPLSAHGEIAGALTIFAKKEGAFGGEVDDEMGSFADQIALSILTGLGQEKIDLQRVALETAANAIVITDTNGVIEWVNPAFTRLTGYTSQEAIGETPRLIRSGSHGRAFYAAMWAQIKTGGVWRGEMYNRRKDGTIYPEEQTITPVRDMQGKIVHFVAIKQDITERKAQEEQIEFLAHHDALTALPNRRAFEATLSRFVHDVRAGRSAAILILDIDEFKLVNDSAGHPVGDQLLMEVAARLQAQLRPGDFLARIGGDEFVVLLHNVNGALARDIAERLRRAIESMWFEHERQTFPVTVSVGLALFENVEDAKVLVSNADAAMYGAKEQGKNRVVTYPLANGDGVHDVTRWLARIREAMRDGGFFLTFQPIVQLDTGETVHYEALLRMRLDDGIAMPEQFLPCAERYSLMPQVDRWVFDEVMRILRERPSMRIFMNLSGRSLTDEPLLQHIEETLRQGTIESGRISFEITETAAVGDFASARHWVRRLKDLGCSIAVDDFGVGFSSLGYLRALAVDYVKIDRTFVRDLDTNATNRALVQAVNTVARTLGKEVIAEGVETEAHANVLREMGIEHAQGYHWGYPAVLGPKV